MATEPQQNLNTNSNGKTGGSYREMVPPGISVRPEGEGLNGQGREEESRRKQELTAWQRVQIARHPDRPHTFDYVERLCTDFVEMHGDRLFGDDAAIVGGPARFDGQTVMLIGQQKGRTTKENIARNFGMPQPEGYRKAQRLMRHAERFGFPVLTFIDTPGANPGVQSEERGIGQAIAESLLLMVNLQVPIIATVIGEGGSGGALAIGVGDRILMLENSIYSVASPEASAAILWRDAAQASAAAETMRITAPDLHSFGIIDEIIPEPEGGAHNDSPAAIEAVSLAIARSLAEVQSAYNLNTKKGIRQMVEDRRHKYRLIGRYADETHPSTP